MRKISVDLIRGNEVLARDIYSSTDTILMAAGTILKKDYIEKFSMLNIKFVYIESENKELDESEKEFLESKIKKECQSAVKNIFEKYSYCGNAELERLVIIAQQLIEDILQSKEVLYSVDVVRQKSESVYVHCLNVCALSVLVALKMNLPMKTINDIAVGSLLHDIGYSFFLSPVDEIVNDSELNSEVKKHVVYGYSIVEKEIWLSKEAKNVILYHHERLDHTGYPLKIGDSRIGLETRVVSVCDEFERYVFRNNKPVVKVHEAIEYIISQAGIKFDYKVVMLFKESVAAYPNGTMIITNEGEKGIVLRQNSGFPTRPVIKLLFDKSNIELENPIEKDLTKELSLFIYDVIM
ncbi:HD-GYP domain-containing protein [Anaeromicropila populeti]|uniref:HD-GYP domain, c-di-GMP phosphodiesterase class II (Or its inactivated variant) n=1 Tax=Anaeromicropila populeti TaxID=37658 RepID=A0A1I6LMH4_9FIRM|nr:HD domain-containing phosphohydrolase [Anaeromicropila populeti]SFS04641.1 HD-GYP domain, c-di-GMP phosphodiesterase class II (or its inactivated variant) [Anaeromicropila populeti]